MKKGQSIKDTKPYILNQKPQPPIQYQRGWTEFYKLKFKLTPDVLIPRPETELLVEEVLNRVQSEEFRVKNENNNSELLTHNSTLTILDIGTGSGCIAISIAKNLPRAKIFAVDISPKALKIAETNTKHHKVENRILFLSSDLLSIFIPPSNTNDEKNPRGTRGTSATRGTFDIIVANLPYIPTARLLLIDPMVTEFEPRIALDGGGDGFDLYRKLFQQIILLNSNNTVIPTNVGIQLNNQLQGNKYDNIKITSPKILIAEIDEEQAETALAEAKKYFPTTKIEIKKDLHKKDRILVINFS